MLAKRRYSPARSALSFGQLACSMSCVAVFSFLLSHSHFLDVFSFGDAVRSGLLILEIFLVLSGILLCFATGHVLQALAALLMFAAVPFYAYIFGSASGQDAVLSSGGDYLFFASFALLFLVVHGNQGEVLLRAIYRMSVVYAVLYILLVAGISLNIISVGLDSHMILDSGGGIDRGLRVALVNSFVVFGTCVSTISTIRKFSWARLAHLTIFSISLYLSGSRYVSALTAVAVVFFAVFRNTKYTRNLFFIAFAVGLLLVTFVILTQNYNPLDGFVDERAIHGDVSAWARWKDVNIAHKLIPDHWLFGIGIPNGVDAYKPISGVSYFYPQDIGLLGIFVMFGVVGYVIYVFICFCACFSYQKLQSDDFSLKTGLGVAGAVMAVFSHLAPVFIANALPFAALFLALFAWRPSVVSAGELVSDLMCEQHKPVGRPI